MNRRKPEQIVKLLRQAEEEMAKGQWVASALVANGTRSAP